MVLVDTSAWIHFLRPQGDATTRDRVIATLYAGTAAWCPIVRLELWNGAAGDRERKTLREFERVLPDLEISAAVWGEAIAVALMCRRAGISVPATDILIAACARIHDATILHADSDFDDVDRVTDAS